MINMQNLKGNLLITFYTAKSILHLIPSFFKTYTVRFFDWLFWTDVYSIQTRPNVIEAQLRIWLKFREVYKKYFPDEVEELNQIDQEINLIQRDLE